MYTNTELVLTSWSVVSSLGLDSDTFAEVALQGARPDALGQPLPGGPLDLVAPANGFSVEESLGRKGTRSFDRTTAMVVATTGKAIAQRDLPESMDRDRVGLVIGTSAGSVRSIMEFTRDTLVHERPYLVNPALFPNTVMNCAAGQTAIWHSLRGVNATISGGTFSMLLALQYASLVVRRSYADVLFVGAAEELCDQTVWAYYRSMHSDPRAHALSEGCAMFGLESKPFAEATQKKVLAEVAGIEHGLYVDAVDVTQVGLEAAMRECVQNVLQRAGLAPSDIWLVSRNGCGPRHVTESEQRIIAELFPPSACERQVAVSELVGNTLSASGAMQIAAVLSHFERIPSETKRYALLTTLGQDGTAGAILLRG